MSIRNYKPYTPGTRKRSLSDFSELTKSEKGPTGIRPEKSLTCSLHRPKGRNNRGIITCRHRGGGHKKLYRDIDFKREKIGVPGKVIRIEYDPNRNSRIALLHYQDGDKKYVLSPHGLKVGETLIADINAPILTGNSLPISKMPLGIEIYNVELLPGAGGKLARAAGTVVQLIAKQGKFVTLRLPSKEIRLVSKNCWASIGQVGNIDFVNLRIGKAGRTRWLGKRPTVRGVVMNPVDHPHGGGEGRAPIGRCHPVTPWGSPALGRRTRNSKKYSTKLLVRRRITSGKR